MESNQRKLNDACESVSRAHAITALSREVFQNEYDRKQKETCNDLVTEERKRKGEAQVPMDLADESEGEIAKAARARERKAKGSDESDLYISLSGRVNGIVVNEAERLGPRVGSAFSLDKTP